MNFKKTKIQLLGKLSISIFLIIAFIGILPITQNICLVHAEGDTFDLENEDDFNKCFNERTGTLGIPEGCKKINQRKISSAEPVMKNRLAKIKSITIPASISEIGSSAFKDCENLENVIFKSSDENPSQLKSISNHCFANCIKLSNVTLPIGLKTIGDSAFNNTIFERIEIPASVETIGIATFAANIELKTVIFKNSENSPSKIKKLDTACFSGCFKLFEINLPEGLQTIEFNAFSLSGIKAIEIPASVQTIHPRAFECCDGIKVTFRNRNQPSQSKCLLI